VRDFLDLNIAPVDHHKHIIVGQHDAAILIQDRWWHIHAVLATSCFQLTRRTGVVETAAKTYPVPDLETINTTQSNKRRFYELRVGGAGGRLSKPPEVCALTKKAALRWHYFYS
jgi:hypothetical protein